MQRREFLKAASIGTAALSLSSAFGAETRKPVNLLFIMTDQQRWDAMGCAGNEVLRTPNLDKLARQGVRFTNAYSSCPVCVPARAVMLTGYSIESIGVTSNQDQNKENIPDLPSFDQILLRNGYRGEYHGKWHTPYKLAFGYSLPVRYLNGRKPPAGCEAKVSEAESFTTYVSDHVPERPLKPGEQVADMYKRPYMPDPLDGAYGLDPGEVQQISRDKAKAAAQQIGQAFTYGCIDVPPEHSRTAVTVKEGLAGLERLKDGPFTLTLSIGPPHPPMLAPKPYYGMFPAESIPAPKSIDDPRTDSPYSAGKKAEDGYRDPAKIRQMRSVYYGMVAEIDDWVGLVLARLDELGLSENTLVIFTSDHGEMLGDHGMHSKGVFYEGAVHVPLLMRLPGTIKPGTVVDAPVSHIDYFATILDYCGMPKHRSEGESLRSLIDGKNDSSQRIAVSEWPNPSLPGFMVFDGRWKLLFARAEKNRSVDALYDLEKDPEEIQNLIGKGYAKRTTYLAQAEEMKGLLVEWLKKVNSPHLESVKKRPVA